jgi:AcrR family transcriptional regulator
MATQSERTESTRKALIDAGCGLFAERGYADVPVADIATRAQVTTGALYHQFGSKEELFRAVYAELVGRVRARVLETRQSGGEPTLLSDCEAYIAACADPAFNRITIDGPAVIGWDRILDEAQSMIEVSLIDAHARGELAAAPVALLARMLAAALKEAAVTIAKADGSRAARRAARDSSRRLISGLLATRAQD